MVQATPLLRPYNLAGPMVLEGVLVDKGFMYRQRLEDLIAVTEQNLMLSVLAT